MERYNKIGWNITTNCNYNCSYCLTKIIKSKKNNVSRSPLKFIDRFTQILDGKWEINLEGAGEPFLAPDFFEVTKRLAESGFFISIVTNFSHSHTQIKKFIEYAGDQLLNFGATLHLEHTDPKKFINKVSYFNKIIPGKIFIKYLATKNGVKLMRKIIKEIEKNQIKYIIYAERKNTEYGLGHSRKYTKSELDLISSYPPLFWRDLIFTKRLCWAGCKHINLQENGDAYRCAPSRTQNSKDGYLGNIFDKDFKLLKNTKACMTKNCYCSFSWLDKKVRNSELNKHD